MRGLITRKNAMHFLADKQITGAYVITVLCYNGLTFY